MKCEKCNEQEAVFHYSSNLNGKVTERHLCRECAQAEGFGSALEFRPMQAFDRAFAGMFEDFFPSRAARLTPFDLFDRSLRAMMSPMLPQFFFGEPTGNAETKPQTPAAAPASEAEQRIPSDAGAQVRADREREALKHQLQEAVAAENFEKAIELRDRLKAMGG